jgi:acetolactate synthase I/II/III large subunit
MTTNAASVAEALRQYGTTHLFGLMGDGNMHLFVEVAAAGIDIVEVRHESASIAMAEGYGWSSGRVGVASVTHGPGLTHMSTSLVVAARNHSPLVVLAGETPSGYAGAQAFDQRRFVEACEALYRSVGPDDDAGVVVRNALTEAASARRPIVVGIPADLLERDAGRTTPLAVSQPAPISAQQNAAAADDLLDAIARSRRPVLLAGRGVVASGSAALVEEIADRLGAPLSVTLPAKGMFDGHPNDLGIAGGLSNPQAERVFADADLVLALGTNAGASTTRSGLLFPDAVVLRLDDRTGSPDRPTASLRVLGEASAVLTLVVERLREDSARSRWFTPIDPWPTHWDEELESFRPEIPDGTLDPRHAAIALDPLLPDDAIIVIANGHCSGFASGLLHGTRDRTVFLAQGFGSIGQGLTSAIGVAFGAPERRVVLFEGDAGFMMHAQEVDTLARSKAPLTAIVFNDEALGTEYHRLQHEPHGGALAIVPADGIAPVVAALGLHAERVTANDDVVPAVLRALDERSAVVELRTARTVESRHLRWRHLDEMQTPAPQSATR